MIHRSLVRRPGTFPRNFTSTFIYTVFLAAFVALHINPGVAVAGGKQVTVYDHGLDLAIGTYTLPEGWELISDIATDPGTGQFTRYTLDKLGPRGEVSRSLPPRMYGANFGPGFEQAWRQLAQQGLQDILQGATVGQPRRDGPMLTNMRNSPKIRKIMSNGSIKDIFEVDVSGKHNGKPSEGKIVVAVMPIDSQSGVLVMGILLSPPDLLMQTIAKDIEIAESKKDNPRYQQVQQQINQRVQQNMQAQHNQRMRANQQQFESHQKMMQDRYRSNDQQHQQWMDNFKNDGSGGTGNNGYSSHDAYIDSIHEQSTFYDPDSGQNVSRDGRYDYNYTDGLGNYYGTDDPSFNQHSLPGDWQETAPLEPNY